MGNSSGTVWRVPCVDVITSDFVSDARRRREAFKFNEIIPFDCVSAEAGSIDVELTRE